MCKIIDTISQNINIFDLFTNIYIFGSSLNSDKYPNDIDLLLTYKIYSKKISDEKNNISSYLEKLLSLPIDLTVLSEEELQETKFLEKISPNYKKLK